MQNNLTVGQKEKVETVLGLNPFINRENLVALVEATNGITGCSIISIRGYNSLASNQTEVADHLVNVGGAYENMVTKAARQYADITAEDFKTALDEHNFGKYVVPADLDAFKAEIRASFPTALGELLTPSKKTSVDNWIYINKVLKFNINTLNLAISGQSLKKTTKEKGEFTPVKSAAKTIAKNVIKEWCETSKDSLRTFIVGLLDTVKVSGQTFEITNNEPA